MREKVALIVFLALVVFGLSALVWYLSVGKTWNVAAATIDDATGQMDGYIAILYEGTVPSIETTDSKLNDISDLDQLDSSDATDTEPLESDQPDSLVTETNTARSQAGKSVGQLVEKPPVTTQDVALSYEKKNAWVYTLDVVNPSKYQEGLIIRKGNQRFGVLSVKLMDSSVSIEEKIEYFESHKVDFVIALVPDKYLVQNIPGIDVVISTKNINNTSLGETISGTFYVNTPTIGSVGATLVSPHHVVSAKVIQEL